MRNWGPAFPSFGAPFVARGSGMRVNSDLPKIRYAARRISAGFRSDKQTFRNMLYQP